MKSEFTDDPSRKIVSLIKEYGIRPQKSLGQNFLIDPVHIKKVVNSAELSGDEEVLEIGPGVGNLTYFLAKIAHKIVAVELDPYMIPPLKEYLSSFTNITIIEGDILKQDINKIITSSNYVVVANIPYYITSKLIRHLLEASRKPDRIILTVQSEVALRICASPPDMNLLGLSVQVYGEPRIVTKIPAGAFYPKPKVDSSIIRIDILPIPRIKKTWINDFFALAKAGFKQKRKNLRNSLSAGLSLTKSEVDSLLLCARIDPSRRPQTLNFTEWELLTSCYWENIIAKQR